MPLPIEDVLNRRSDLSTFLVHLTRESGGQSAREHLESIAHRCRLEARTPLGWTKEQDDPGDPAKQSQRVVCFSECPLEHIYSLVADIQGRAIKLEPYGVALTKLSARARGVNPVWYVDMTPGRDWLQSSALNTLRDQAVATGRFHEQPVAQLFPFFESMGTWPSGRQKEFWWEREWRHIGGFHVDELTAIWLCPEEEIGTISARGHALTPCIDPRWSLEHIVAHLAHSGTAATPVSIRERHPSDPLSDLGIF